MMGYVDCKSRLCLCPVSWLLPVAPGVSGGAGAAHGPSAQHVQAGAERCRSNSGETLEVLRVRRPRFSVTQGERTHTLGKHATVNRYTQHLRVCVRAFFLLETGNCKFLLCVCWSDLRLTADIVLMDNNRTEASETHETCKHSCHCLHKTLYQSGHFSVWLKSSVSFSVKHEVLLNSECAQHPSAPVLLLTVVLHLTDEF